MDLLSALTAMVKQITNQPACLYVILMVNVVIFIWEVVPKLPSKLIVLVGPVLGGFLYLRYGSIASVPAEFPHPKDILFANGFIAGLLSVAVHAAVVALLRKTTGWPPESNNKPCQPKTPEDPKV